MIRRYTPKRIGRVWTDRNKFMTWLRVELAAIKARCNLGIFPKKAYPVARAKARFSTAAVILLDAVLHHDLQAFIEVVRKSLPRWLRQYFHKKMTSYDTEVPALALQFRQAGRILLADLDKLIVSVRSLANKHLWTYCMGITHGQDAQPTTFGWRLCSYLEMLEEARDNLRRALNNVEAVKFSGAVGNYSSITPEEEREVCKILGLRVRKASTQIVGRDVFCRLLAEISTIGGVIEKIATDFRLQILTAYGEVEEPRGKRQKGSTAMPHKKNPILLERMCGMAIILRGYAVMGQEVIRTWWERDIAHSCVERVAFPDATIILDYMFQTMTRIFNGLEVNRERMAKNIERTHGCWASEAVKTLLCEEGLDPDDVYEYVQKCAFEAMRTQSSFGSVVLRSVFPGHTKPLNQVVSTDAVNYCFTFRVPLEKSLPEAYARFNLDPALSLPPNTSLY